MDDIVRPYWDSTVKVEGIRQKRQLIPVRPTAGSDNICEHVFAIIDADRRPGSPERS